jgi:hypothetical protein
MHKPYPRERALRSATLAACILAVSSLLLPASTWAATRATTVAVRNLMPQFWDFWQTAQNKPAAEQLQLWRQLYERPNAALFGDLRGVCAKDWASNALQKEYFPVLKGLIPGMRSLSASLPSTIDAVQKRFAVTFPDMSWAGPIYIMASAGCFNGRSQVIEGRPALLLAVDVIVDLDETNLAPLVTHETFHRYHYGFFPFEPQLPQPLWVRLWAEGMATYAAHRLNPAASNLDLMTIAPKEIAQLNARLPSIASDFMGRFSSSSQADATLYFSDDSTSPRIPARAGYYLGLRVSEYLGRRYSLQTMAHWNHAEAKPHIVAALGQLQRLR